MSVGGGGGTSTKAYRPQYYEVPESGYSFMTPGQDIINELARSIGQQTGYQFGGRNLFGSGIMQDSLAERLAQAAMGATQFVQRGQYISPQVGQRQDPSWRVGIGGF